MSSREPEDLNQTLYRHGLSLAVLFDLLVKKGILTPEEIQQQARSVNRKLLSSTDDEEPEFSAP